MQKIVGWSLMHVSFQRCSVCTCLEAEMQKGGCVSFLLQPCKAMQGCTWTLVCLIHPPTNSSIHPFTHQITHSFIHPPLYHPTLHSIHPSIPSPLHPSIPILHPSSGRGVSLLVHPSETPMCCLHASMAHTETHPALCTPSRPSLELYLHTTYFES